MLNFVCNLRFKENGAGDFSQDTTVKKGSSINKDGEIALGGGEAPVSLAEFAAATVSLKIYISETLLLMILL